MRPPLLAARLALPLALALAVGAAQAAEPYRIGPGDTLAITVLDQEALSGAFRVDADGTIGHPLLGDVPVAGKPRAEIAAALSAALAEHVPGGAALSVDIADYAPVVVTGAVREPGAYPYRPGLIALELVALAGGERAAPDEVTTGGLVALERELSALRLERYGLLARRARLAAETADAPFDAAAILPEPTLAADARRTIAEAEQALFDTRASVAEGRRAALRAQRASYDVEIETLERSIALHDEEIGLLEAEVAKQTDLVARGLAVAGSLLSLRRELSAVRRDALDMRLSLARANQRQIELDRALAEIAQGRAAENAAMARETQLAILGAERAIASVSRAIAEAGATPLGVEDARLAFAAIRLVSGGRDTVPLDPLDPVLPGDILVVERAAPAAGEGAAAATASLGAPR